MSGSAGQRLIPIDGRWRRSPPWLSFCVGPISRMRRLGFVLLFAGFLAMNWQASRSLGITVGATNEQMARLGNKPSYDSEEVYAAVRRAARSASDPLAYVLCGLVTFTGGMFAGFGIKKGSKLNWAQPTAGGNAG